LALPQWVEAALARLGDTLAPLALFSVGYQLRLGALRSRWRPLAAGLGYKLVAGPLLVLLVITSIWGLDGPAARIAVFEAAMAPMIGGAIVAVEHKLDAELATLMLGIGIPLSFLTLPIWSMVLTA
jgi:predicted permease